MALVMMQMDSLLQLPSQNEEAATGGEDEETIAHARKWAPVTYSQQNRLVTEEDYTAAANSFADKGLGRFAKAKAIIHERSGEANVIRILCFVQRC